MSPLVFVPGNHDPDLSGYRLSRERAVLQAGLPARAPWPDGSVNADGRIVDVAGLRIGGLGGCRAIATGRTSTPHAAGTARARLRAAARWRSAWA